MGADRAGIGIEAARLFVGDQLDRTERPVPAQFAHHRVAHGRLAA